jgi:hypothetical protein
MKPGNLCAFFNPSEICKNSSRQSKSFVTAIDFESDALSVAAGVHSAAPGKPRPSFSTGMMAWLARLTVRLRRFAGMPTGSLFLKRIDKDSGDRTQLILENAELCCRSMWWMVSRSVPSFHRLRRAGE